MIRIVEAGEYSFTTWLEDGARVWVDGQLVASSGNGAAVSKTLAVGFHTLRAQSYFLPGGDAMVVKMSGPDTRGVAELVRGFHFATEEEYYAALGFRRAIGIGWEQVELAGGFVGSFVIDETMEWRDFAHEPDYYSFVTVTKGLSVDSTYSTETINYESEAAFRALDPGFVALHPKPQAFNPKP